MLSGSNSISKYAGNRIVNVRGIWGTLGCIAYIKNSNVPVILSNWHVLYGKGAVKNDNVWLSEGNKQRDLTELGYVHSGKIGNIWFHNWEFFVDCAIGTISNPKMIASLPEINGCAEAKPGDKVHKMGAASRLTQGTIIDVKYEEKTTVNGRIIFAKNQLLIRSENSKPFSEGGDSGAVILNKNNEIVGLLWGTNNKGEGLVCPILPVMAALNIEFEKPEVLRSVQ